MVLGKSTKQTLGSEGSVMLLWLFQDAEREFARWLDDHEPDGCIYNAGGGELVHRADCPHFKPHDYGNYTTALKVCSTDLNALVAWVKRIGCELHPEPGCDHCGSLVLKGTSWSFKPRLKSAATGE